MLRAPYTSRDILMGNYTSKKNKKTVTLTKRTKKKVGKVYLGCYSYKQSVRGARGGKCLPSLVALAHMHGGRDA